MILVTGGTGLVGAHILLHLTRLGLNVRATFRSDTGIGKTRRLFRLYGREELFAGIDWQNAEITDVPALEAAIQGCSHVYHCAALISFDPGDEEELRKINIEGTANIVNLSLALGVKKLCHISSTAALGDLKTGEPVVTEETEWNPEKPHNDYAISKYGAEMEVWRGTQEGLQAVILNPGIVLGPGFWDSGSGKIFSSVERGMKYFTRGITGFVDVRDVARLAHESMQSDISGERFIAIAENMEYGQALSRIARRLGRKEPEIYASPFLTGIFWRLDWLKTKLIGGKRRLSRHDSHALHDRSLLSNEKVRTIFDFEFTSIDEAIDNAVVREKGK